MALTDNLAAIKKRIETACRLCGRSPDQVALIAVSKTVSEHRVREAVAAGLYNFGENYIQEARTKIPQVPGQSLTWHFIGHLQTNKVKYAVKLFDLIHTVDSLKLAREIDRQAAKIGKCQSILIQVNVAREESKWGISPSEADALVRGVAPLEHIVLKGLMTMPPFFHQPEKVRPFFRALARLKDRIDQLHVPGVKMGELSMGMSGDFEAAIQEGATLIRVGTAIFGERD
jgi:pyridoxal phosphate enzyme (YggS family)